MPRLTMTLAWSALVVVLGLVQHPTPAAAPPVGFAKDPLPKGAIARLGSSRLRHTWSANAVSFSPDGKFLVSAGAETAGGGDNAIRVWEMPSGRETKTIQLGYRAHVRQVAISPDGSHVVWEDANAAVHGLGEPAHFRRHSFAPTINPAAVKDRGPTPLAFSRDGRYFAAGGDGQLYVQETKAKKPAGFSASVGAFTRCRFSPNGKTLAISDPVAGLRLIDVAIDSKTKGKALSFPAIKPGPASFAFSPDGDRLVTGEYKMVRIWDVASGKETLRIAWGDRNVEAVGFSADDKHVTAVRGDGQVARWLAASGKEVRTFSLPEKALKTRWDQNEQTHSDLDVWGDHFAYTDSNAIRLVDVTRGREITFAAGQPGHHSTMAFAFTPNSKHLVTAGEGDRLQVWAARSGKLVREGKEDTRSVYWLAVTPDGKQVVSLSYNRALHVTARLEEWNLATAKKQRQMELNVSPGMPALSPDGKWIAFGEPNDSRYRMHETGDGVLVDRATGKQIRHFDDGIASAAQDLTFSSDGKLLATVDRKGKIRLWETATGKLVRTMDTEVSEGAYQLRFISRDKAFVSVSWNYNTSRGPASIVEWDVATGKANSRREGPKEVYWCRALSPDAKLFAWAGRVSRGHHEQVEVWDVNKEKVRQTGVGLRGGPGFLGFSPDGRLLASGCYDGTVLIWEVAQR